MCGSAMNLIGTGIPNSQALKLLSSLVVMNLRSSSTNVIELTGWVSQQVLVFGREKVVSYP